MEVASSLIENNRTQITRRERIKNGFIFWIFRIHSKCILKFCTLFFLNEKNQSRKLSGKSPHVEA